MDILFAQVPELHWRPKPGSPPSMSLPTILSSPSFLQKPCVRLPQISAFSGFILYFGEEWECVCVSFFLALATFSAFFFPLLLLSSPLPSPRPCLPRALTVNVEPGSSDATTPVPSFLLVLDWTWKHRSWLTRCLRIVSWSLLGFLFRQREQKQNLLVGWKTGLSPSSVLLSFSLCLFFVCFFGSILMDILSVPTPLCSLRFCFMFVSVT